MALQDVIIERIRYKVGDIDTPYTYSDETYVNVGVFPALSRINFDFSQSYTLATLPVKFEFLVVLLGAAEMVKRTVLDMGRDAESGSLAARVVVRVPDLDYESGAGNFADIMYRMRQIAHQWVGEYEDIVDRLNAVPDVDYYSGKTRQVFLRSKKTGGLRPRTMDSGIDAPLDFVGVVGSGVINFEWPVVLDTEFKAYNIYASTSPGVTHRNGSLWAKIGDNHRNYVTVSRIKTGVYYVVLYVESRNGLFGAPSDEINVVVL